MLNYIDSGELNLLPFIEELLTYFTGFGIGAILGIMVAVIIGAWLIGAAILKLALYIKKIPSSYARCLGTTALNFVLGIAIGFVPVIGIFLGLIASIWTFKQRHTYDWWDAVIVWLLSVLIPFVIGVVIVLGVLGIGGIF